MESLSLVWESRDGGGLVVTALIDRQIVGQAFVRFEADSCELEWVRVAEAWRHHGIGRALIGEVQSRCDHIKACAVSAEGARLLRECGFEDFAEPGVDWVWPPDSPEVASHDF
jgi:GNAT superfamily N-acetyltransferase